MKEVCIYECNGPNVWIWGGGKNTSELNFTVKAYSTEEELLSDKPKDNTIGVITDTTIISYILSHKEPIDPSEGIVWISTVNSESIEFNVLKKNALFICISTSKQYINGEWVIKNSKIYKDEQWVEIFYAIINVTYPEGLVCTATDGITTLTSDTSGTYKFNLPNTGTWTITVLEKGWSETVTINNYGDDISVYLDKFYIYRDGNLKFEIQNNYKNVWSISSATGYLIGHANGGIGNALILGFKDSLSGFNQIQIKAKVLNYGNAGYYYGYVSKYNTWSTCLDNRAASVSMTSSAEKDYTLNVANVTGNYYLWFAWQASSNVDVQIIEIGCI